MKNDIAKDEHAMKVFFGSLKEGAEVLSNVSGLMCDSMWIGWMKVWTSNVNAECCTELNQMELDQ